MTNQVPTFRDIETAIRGNDENVIEKLRVFLNANPNNINSGDSNGATLLHYACACGNESVVRYLLSNNVNNTKPQYDCLGIESTMANNKTSCDITINGVTYKSGSTPLHMAAKSGNMNIVRMLLCAGANPKIRNDASLWDNDLPSELTSNAEIRTLLEDFSSRPANRSPYDYESLSRNSRWADFFNTSDMVHVLSNSATNNGVVKDDRARLRNLLNSGACLHTERLYRQVSSMTFGTSETIRVRQMPQTTPMMIALAHPGRWPNGEKVESYASILLDYGARLNGVTENGENVIHYLALYGRTDIFDRVVARVPESFLTQSDKNGYQPLEIALAKKNWDVVSALLKQPSVVNSLSNLTNIDGQNRNVIHYLAMGNRIETFNQLAAKISDALLTQKDNAGYTPFERAIISKNWAFADALLTRSAVVENMPKLVTLTTGFTVGNRRYDTIYSFMQDSGAPDALIARMSEAISHSGQQGVETVVDNTGRDSSGSEHSETETSAEAVTSTPAPTTATAAQEAAAREAAAREAAERETTAPTAEATTATDERVVPENNGREGSVESDSVATGATSPAIDEQPVAAPEAALQPETTDGPSALVPQGSVGQESEREQQTQPTSGQTPDPERIVALQKAIRIGDWSGVENLLADPSVISFTNIGDQNRNIIHYLAIYNQSDLFNQVASKVPESFLTQPDKDGRTPLELALRVQNWDMAQSLLAQSAVKNNMSNLMTARNGFTDGRNHYDNVLSYAESVGAPDALIARMSEAISHSGQQGVETVVDNTGRDSSGSEHSETETSAEAVTSTPAPTTATAAQEAAAQEAAAQEAAAQEAAAQEAAAREAAAQEAAAQEAAAQEAADREAAAPEAPAQEAAAQEAAAREAAAQEAAAREAAAREAAAQEAAAREAAAQEAAERETTAPTAPVVPTPAPTAPVVPTPAPTAPVLPTPAPTAPVVPTPAPTAPVEPTLAPTAPVVPDPVPEQAQPTDEEGGKPNDAENQVQVIRHRYGADSDESDRRIITHQEAVDFAKNRNQSRLNRRRRGQRNRNRATPYATAIENIKRMENMGLIPKGPNGESNAEVYLYRLYQAREFYHQDEYLMVENGEYRRVSELFQSADGKSLRRVYSNLISRDLTDEQLRNYARTILAAERCIDNMGHDRTCHQSRVLDRYSYRPGQTNNINQEEETVTRTLRDNGESVPEYTQEALSSDQRVAIVGNQRSDYS